MRSAAGEVAPHGFARAHHFARRAVENLKPLGVARRVAHDARGLTAPAVLVDEDAAVGQPLGRVLDLAQPAEGLDGLPLGEPGPQQGEERPAHHLRAPSSATVRT
jgi:hypothetical protein